MKMKEKPQIIMRAYGDEPVCLRVRGIEGGRVDVFRDNEALSLSLPRAFIYRFSHDVFTELRQAYEANDRLRLQQLWCKAEHYTETSS